MREQIDDFSVSAACLDATPIFSDYARDFSTAGGAWGSRQVDERWHSVEDIAEHLGVAADTVYRWINRKALPAHRVGRLWKFKFSEVDAWVRSGGANEKNRTATKPLSPQQKRQSR